MGQTDKTHTVYSLLYTATVAPRSKTLRPPNPLHWSLFAVKRPKGVELVVTVPTPVDSGRSDCDPTGGYGPWSLAVYDDSGLPLR
jgi:hypothetical protein